MGDEILAMDLAVTMRVIRIVCLWLSPSPLTRQPDAGLASIQVVPGCTVLLAALSVSVESVHQCRWHGYCMMSRLGLSWLLNGIPSCLPRDGRDRWTAAVQLMETEHLLVYIRSS